MVRIMELEKLHEERAIKEKEREHMRIMKSIEKLRDAFRKER